MARRRYSREAVQRAVRSGAIPPLVCALCGQRFWTEDQRKQHDGGTRNGVRVCLYTVARGDQQHSPLIGH